MRRLWKGCAGGSSSATARRARPRSKSLPEPPELPERPVPIRFRKSVPTAWLRLTLREGRNRQVRRMTAAVGHPTLRLVRVAIGPMTLGGLAPGQWRELSEPERQALEAVRDQEQIARGRNLDAIGKTGSRDGLDRRRPLRPPIGLIFSDRLEYTGGVRPAWSRSGGIG